MTGTPRRIFDETPVLPSFCYSFWIKSTIGGADVLPASDEGAQQALPQGAGRLLQDTWWLTDGLYRAVRILFLANTNPRYRLNTVPGHPSAFTLSACPT